jgi:hypothetical protein
VWKTLPASRFSALPGLLVQVRSALLELLDRGDLLDAFGGERLELGARRR